MNYEKEIVNDIINKSKGFGKNKRCSIKFNPYIQEQIDVLYNRVFYLTGSENIHEIFYHILNDIYALPKCPVCGKKPKFKGLFYEGSYNTTCSKICSNKHKIFAMARGKSAHNTKINNIVVDGRNSYDRLIEKVQKKIHTPNIEGKTPFRIGIEKRKETMNEIFEDTNKTRMKILQELAKKASQTKYNNIDTKTGLNLHEIIGLMSSKIQSSREHKLKMGFILPKNIPDKEKYYKLVWLITERNYKKYFSEINPNNFKRGSYLDLGTHQLDHKFSISEGFKKCILPDIIASKHNLTMLTIIDNNKKGNSCSISEQELFGKIY